MCYISCVLLVYMCYISCVLLVYMCNITVLYLYTGVVVLLFYLRFQRPLVIMMAIQAPCIQVMVREWCTVETQAQTVWHHWSVPVPARASVHRPPLWDLTLSQVCNIIVLCLFCIHCIIKQRFNVSYSSNKVVCFTAELNSMQGLLNFTSLQKRWSCDVRSTGDSANDTSL